MNKLSLPLSIVALSVLTACGGGDGGGSDSSVTAPASTLDAGSNMTLDLSRESQLTLAAQSSNMPDGTAYKWTSSSDGIIFSDDSILAPVVIFEGDMTSGDVTLTLTASTPSGDNYTDDVVVSVTENDLDAVVSIGSDRSLDLNVATSFSLTAAVTNPESGSTYEWSASDASVTFSDADSLTTTVNVDAAMASGVVTVSFKLTEPDGDVVTEQIALTVIEQASTALNVLHNVTPAFAEPSIALSGPSGQIEQFNSNGEISQILFTDHESGNASRIIVDEATGEYEKIIDQATGDYVKLVNVGAERVDFLFYNASDEYQSGIAIFRDGDEYYSGTIDGVSVFDGQITGQMDTGSQTGSYVLVADETSTLSNVQLLPQEYQDMISAELADSLTLVSAKSAISPMVVAPASSSVSLSNILKKAGVVAIGAGVIVGTASSAPVMMLAGAGMLIAGYASNDIADIVEDNFATDNDVAQGYVNFVVDFLRDPDSDSLQDRIESVATKYRDISGYVSKQTEALSEFVDTYSDVDLFEDAAERLDDLVDNALIPDSIEEPPAVPSYIEGQAVFQDGRTYSVSGTINEDGEFVVTGDQTNSSFDLTDDINIEGTLDVNTDMVSGTFETVEQSGVVESTGIIDGEAEELGECNSSSGSGGDGTFSFAHNVGLGDFADFSFDAYSIPDAFDVYNGGTNVYSTGGLVSGGTTVALAVTSPIVMVNIYAPESGTAWNYRLGCAYTSSPQ